MNKEVFYLEENWSKLFASRNQPLDSVLSKIACFLYSRIVKRKSTAHVGLGLARPKMTLVSYKNINNKGDLVVNLI